MTAAVEPKSFRINGWHVLAGFVAFFAAVLTVDTIMMIDAYKTYSGEVATTPYEDGLAYNTERNQQAAQAALGWRMTAGLTAPGLIRLDAIARDGRPLSALRIDARLERPATEQGRRILAFREVAPGQYEAPAAGLAGAWDLRLSAFDRDGHRFDAERRLISP